MTLYENLVLVDLDSILYKACWNKTSIIDVKVHFKNLINRLIDIFPDKHFVLYISGVCEYRRSLYPNYKSNRGPKPELLYKLKEFVFESYNIRYIPFLEADDLIAIDYKLCNRKSCIIAHIDKDLNQIPGTHFNYNSEELYYVNSHTAKINLYNQVIVGDSSDNIPGIKGKGIKYCEKELAKLKKTFTFKKISRIWLNHCRTLCTSQSLSFQLQMQLLSLGNNQQRQRLSRTSDSTLTDFIHSTSAMKRASGVSVFYHLIDLIND